MQIFIDVFRALERGTLRGFARVRLANGLVLHDVAIHRRDGKLWASPAGRPMIDRAGLVIKGGNGKPSYVPIVSFATTVDSTAFGTAVIDAMHAKYPEAVS